MSGDVYYSSVQLLMHMEGVDAGTSFTDNSANALASNTSPFGATHLQPIFGGQTSATHAEFGISSFTGGAGGGAVRVVNNNFSASIGAAYDMTGDFTVEAAFWQAAPDAGDSAILFSTSNFANLSTLFFNLGVANSTSKVFLQVNQSDGTTSVISLNGTTNVSDGQWHQIAVTRAGTTYSLYVDGIRQATGTAAGVIGTGIGDIAMGRTAGNGGNTMHSGWIDEVRYTVGVARYTGASYTPPTAPFPDGPPVIDSQFYGKFVNAGMVFKPIQSANLGNAKPRVFQPFDNQTIKVPQ